MSRRESSNIKVADRVDAVVAAMNARWHLRMLLDAGHHRSEAVSRARERVAFIVAALGKAFVDRAQIAHHVDAILQAELPRHWLVAHVRLELGQLKRFLGLPLDELSTRALAAWEGQSAEADTWKPYTDAFMAPAAVEIAIPAECGGAQ